MNKILKKLLLVGTSLFLLAGAAEAHTVALGWQVQPSGDVIFYNSHWHGAQTSTSNTGLFIDSVEYKFTGIENNLNSRTGLDGAIFNPSYFDWTAGTGTLAVASGAPSANDGFGVNDWFTVTVSGLAAGTHTFGTTNIALTQWDIPSSGGTVTVVLPPPPPPSGVPETGSSLLLLGLALIGIGGFARKKS